MFERAVRGVEVKLATRVRAVHYDPDPDVKAGLDTGATSDSTGRRLPPPLLVRLFLLTASTLAFLLRGGGSLARSLPTIQTSSRHRRTCSGVSMGSHLLTQLHRVIDWALPLCICTLCLQMPPVVTAAPVILQTSLCSQVRDQCGGEERFDRVVFACPATAAASTLSASFYTYELSLLRGVAYHDDVPHSLWQSIWQIHVDHTANA